MRTLSAMISLLIYSVTVAECASRKRHHAQLLAASLLTLNAKHFPMFPDLEPAYR